MLWLTKRQLKSKDAAARRKAVEKLCQTPHPRAFRALRASLADEDAEVRRFAATALGKLEDERCLEPLLEALRDRDAGVLKAAILALKRSSDERVVAALLPLLRHPDAGVRGQAAQVLEFSGWRPASGEEEIRLLAAKGQFARMASHGVPAIAALEAVIDSGPYSLCVGAVEALGEIGDTRALRALLRALEANDSAVCVAAVDALCRVGDPQVVEPLIAALRHHNGHVRAAAIDALRRLDATTAVEPLRALLRDPVWDVRRAAAEALGRLKDPRALDALAEALADGDGDVREASVRALGGLGDRRAIGPLVLALKDPTSGVRRIAAAALSRIDPDWSSSAEAQGAVKELKSALHEGDSNVRHFVGQLLVSLGVMDQEAAPEAAVDELLASAPAKRRKLAVSLFVSLLCDVDRDLRQAAAEALGRLGDDRAHSPLLRALGDPDAGVRCAVEVALKSFGASSEARP